MTGSGLQPQAESQSFVSQDGHRPACSPAHIDTHRWPRATTSDERWGPLCECGNLKTDQALSCNDCAVERRRAPDYWERRTCVDCGGPKSKHKIGRCLRCEHEARRADPGRWDFGSSSRGATWHRWRRREALRRLAS